MRKRFGDYFATELGPTDESVLLVGDIGFGIFDQLRSQYPSKFINCGVAEQNMIGVASGMAAKGFQPWVYTIIPFLLYRPYELVRNLIGHQRLGVSLVGVGAGLSYAKLGFTHFALEDLSIARTVPNLLIYTPYDGASLERCLDHRATVSDEPAYFRLYNDELPDLQPLAEHDGFDILFDNGCDVILICHGSTSNEVLKAAHVLKGHNIKSRVISVWCLDIALELQEFLSNGAPCYFIEEHFYPGLLSSLAQQTPGPSHFINIKYHTLGSVNDRQGFLALNQMDEFGISSRVLGDLRVIEL